MRSVPRAGLAYFSHSLKLAVAGLARACEARALALAREHRRERVRAQAVADHGGDPRGGRHVGGHHLRAHPARAERRGRVPDLELLAVPRSRSPRPRSRASGCSRGSAVYSPSMSVSRISSSAATSTATCAARKSLSPKEISSVAVVSFSLITGSTRHSSSVLERLARVQVVRAGAHVEERQQHLRAGHAALAQQLVVDAVELALADRAGRLQLADRGRTLRQAHHAHAPRDRAAGDDDHLPALAVHAGEQVAHAREHVHARLAVARRRRRSSRA